MLVRKKTLHSLVPVSNDGRVLFQGSIFCISVLARLVMITVNSTVTALDLLEDFRCLGTLVGLYVDLQYMYD